MQISAVNSNSYQKQSFGLKTGNIVNEIISTAYFHSMRAKNNPELVSKTIARIDRIKKMHDGFILTTLRDGNKDKDFYRFFLTPLGMNKNCSKQVATISSDMPSIVMLAKLEKALKKFNS